MNHELDRVDLPETASLDARGPRPNAQAQLFLVRALAFSARSARSIEELDLRSGHRLARIVQDAAGLDLSADGIGLRELRHACDAAEVAAEQQSTRCAPSSLCILGDQVARAFGHRKSEIALLRLALQANASPVLRQTLNLAGEIDDCGMSRLLETVLEVDAGECLEDLRRDNPLLRMSRGEVYMAFCVPSIFLRLADNVVALLKQQECSAHDILSLYVEISPPPKLLLSDFQESGPSIDLVIRYLRAVLSSNRQGANLLLHGKPGTGKTELVRAAAKELGAKLQEVPAVDEDRDPLPAWRRLTSYGVAQETMRARPRSMVLFDEVEDVFPVGDGLEGILGRAQDRPASRNKGWLTQVLENNPRPTVWVCNSIDQMDPAYVRRFDMVVEMQGPKSGVKGQLVDRLFRDIPLPSASLQRLKTQPHFAPGHLERLSIVLEELAPSSTEEGGRLLDQLSALALDALNIRAPSSQLAGIAFRDDCINANCSLGELTSALEEMPSARLCLYGPPGTGKSAWATHVAQKLGKHVLALRTSDLLSKYVGGTERLIRDAFESAQRSGAVLLIDEADSLLQPRDAARASWEVSMVNEMLTGMEHFDGIFIASTNLVARLDPASARRFDFKVEFSALNPTQCALLFKDMLAALDIGSCDDLKQRNWGLIRGLTPGDFANVLRQARLRPSSRNHDTLFELLAREVEFRGDSRSSMRIGFIR